VSGHLRSFQLDFRSIQVTHVSLITTAERITCWKDMFVLELEYRTTEIRNYKQNSKLLKISDLYFKHLLSQSLLYRIIRLESIDYMNVSHSIQCHSLVVRSLTNPLRSLQRHQISVYFLIFISANER